jgi:plastocyanin
MRAFWSRGLVSCLVALATLPPALAAEVSGHVRLVSKLHSRKVGKSHVSTYMSMEAADVPPPSESELENVIIYLEGANLSHVPQLKRTADNTMAQHHKEFQPHVLAVTEGSKVYFENLDPFPHEVYSVSSVGPFEIEKHSGIRSQQFNKAGVVEIFCGIHTRMNAYLLVLKNGAHTRVHADGGYRLANVPAGHYILHAWHPRLDKEVTQSVTLPASGTVKLDLSL